MYIYLIADTCEGHWERAYHVLTSWSRLPEVQCAAADSYTSYLFSNIKLQDANNIERNSHLLTCFNNRNAQ